MKTRVSIQKAICKTFLHMTVCQLMSREEGFARKISQKLNKDISREYVSKHRSLPSACLSTLYNNYQHKIARCLGFLPFATYINGDA